MDAVIKTIEDLTTEEMRTMLLSIHGDLSGKEWDADSLDSIAQTFRLFGVEVPDRDEGEREISETEKIGYLG
jgi:hypothetical protein